MLDLFQPIYFHYAATVILLGILEALLSADNALVLALLIRDLPEKEQKKALSYGLGGALVFRAIAVFLAGYLIRLWIFKAIGAAYVTYMGVAYFWKGHFSTEREQFTAASTARNSFWKIVLQVELTDIAFSLDSIIVAIAVSSNMYVVYLGAVFGIITMRFVAMAFVKLLRRFPALEISAYLILIWIGIKLGVEVVYNLEGRDATAQISEGMPAWLFWGVLLIVFFGAFLFKRGKQRPQ